MRMTLEIALNDDGGDEGNGNRINEAWKKKSICVRDACLRVSHHLWHSHASTDISYISEMTLRGLILCTHFNTELFIKP